MIGVVPNIPGSPANIGLFALSGPVTDMIVKLYDYAWFTGLGISSLVYYLLMRNRV